MTTVIRPNAVHRLLLIGFCLVISFGVTKSTEASKNVVVADVAVVSAASYDVTVAPGSIAALFGSAMTAQNGVAASTIPLPTSLAGLSVKINGILAPLFYASAGQINLQIPSAVGVGTTTVEVFREGTQGAVATGSATVADSAPGVFTVTSSGRDQAAAVNSDYTLNAAFDRFPGSHPEVGGNYVTIYATGIGNTNPLVGDGQPAPSAPLAVATSTTAVNIGGVSAQVLYSGLAPGFVGLWQINAVLAGSLATNFATPLKVELKSRLSPETTLAVASKSEFGNTNGTVVSALDGSPIGGASVSLQPSTTGTVRTATTDQAGHFTINVISVGAYSLAAGATGFITATQNTTIVGAQTEVLPPIALTAPLAGGEYRVVVSWQAASPTLDLDGHLTGPGTGGSRFHVWWNSETNAGNPVTARLDRDDLSGAGPETITFLPQAGSSYRFSVHNYTDRDTNGNARLAASRAIVRIYRGSQQLASVSIAGGGGTLWKVFELIGDQLTVVNQVGDELEPSNIKVSY